MSFRITRQFPFLKSKMALFCFLLLGSSKLFAQAPYCTISYPSGYSSWGMTQVTIGTFTQSPSFSSAYGNFLSSNVAVVAGVSTNVSITITGWASVGIAADFNNDNDFEDAGETLFFPNYNGASPVIYTGNITVPPSVIAGNYRMRIWTRSANGGGANDGAIPCGTYGYGRYADYTLAVTNTATCLPPSNVMVTATSNTAAISWAASTSNPANYRWKVVADGDNPTTGVAIATGQTSATTATANGLVAATNYDLYVKSLCSATDSSLWTLVKEFATLCSGSPAAGIASSNVISVCPATNFTLSLSGASVAPGITYQWQSATGAGGPFVNIAGATDTTFITTQAVASYYRCVVTCSGAGTVISNEISVGINTPNTCYCIPTSTTGTSYYITSFSTSGGVLNIANNSTGSGSYNPYLTQTASQVVGSTVSFSMTSSSAFTFKAIYIDWNQDGAFDETNEKVYAGNYPTVNATTVSGSFTVPVAALVGNTRMRVRSSYYTGAAMNACNNLSYGEAEDYTFTVISPVGVCLAPGNLVISNVSSVSASCTFVAPSVGNSVTNFLYELRTSGLPGSGTAGLFSSGNTATSPLALTNLAPATNYTLYLRSFCSLADSSVWVPVSFNTIFDTLTPVSIRGFNADVVANGIGAATSSTTNDVDGVSFALIAPDFQASSSSTLPTSYLPANRIVQNGVRKYRLADYTGNNSLRQPLATTNGGVKLLAPRKANKLYILGISGSGVSNFNATVHFTDGTTQVQGMSFPDWYTNNVQSVIAGVGRINRQTNAVESGGPRLHDSSIVILEANRNKQIDSVSIQRTGTASGINNVLAISIVPNINQSCKLPGELSISGLTCMGGMLAWNGNGFNASYEISYGPQGTLASAGTIIPITGAVGANTHNFINGITSTNLQFFVRASCGSGSFSDWVGPLNVSLPTTTITPTFTLPSAICSGAIVPILNTTSDNAITGTWSPSAVSNTNTGTYTFTPISGGGCALPVTLTIAVSGQIVPSFTAIPAICEGSAAPLLASTSNNGITGTWSPAVISNTSSATYTFTPLGSIACVVGTTIDVTVNPTSESVDTVQICGADLPFTWHGQSVATGGSNAANHVLTNALGCDSTIILNLVVTSNSSPSISFSYLPGGTVSTGTTVTFNAILNDAASSAPHIQWMKSGTAIPGATGLTWTAVAGVDYYNGDDISVTADSFNSCADAQFITSATQQMNVTVSIGSIPAPLGFEMFPNPAINYLNVQGLKANTKLLIADLLGRVVLQKDLDPLKEHQLDIQQLEAGVYIVIFQNDLGQSWTVKLVKN